MMWVSRTLTEPLLRAVETRPAVLVTGARQTGKSSLLRKLFPDHPYVTFDHVTHAMEAEDNPERFLGRFDGPVILDEIQRVPSLFRELKLRIDADRASVGRWILTGSQRFELMRQGSESLAGRLRVLRLQTLSAAELRNAEEPVSESFLWRGGYPELWARPELDAGEFFEDYISTYLERDLRLLVQVSDLRDFQRLIRACAVRAGQLLNMAELSRDVGIAADTVKRWLAALETGGLIHLLPPYFANIGKRLTKAPKLFFADHGLLCHLVNAGSTEQWHAHPMRGQLWENLVFGELLKTPGLTPGRNLFFYRDQNAVEIDFLVDNGTELTLIEAKAGERPSPRKLNSAKVVKLFEPRLRTHCIVACPMPETDIIHTANYAIYNPVHSDCPVV